MTLIILGPTLFFFFSFRVLHEAQPRRSGTVVACSALPTNRPGETTDSNGTSPEQNIKVLIRCVLPLWPLGWAFIPASTTAASLSYMVPKRKTNNRTYEVRILEIGSDLIMHVK